MTTPLPARPEPRFLPWIIGALIAGLVASVVIMVAVRVLHPPSSKGSSAKHSPPADPRLTYKGPYKNIHPDVKYVGSKVCAECHTKATEEFHSHPMGQSAFEPYAEPWGELPFDPKHRTEAPLDKVFRNPFKIEKISSHDPVIEEHLKNFEFRVRVEGKDVWHDERILDPDDPNKELASISMKLAVVLGSGVHGRTYLVVRDGNLLESPISWYSQTKFWDLSPGYKRANAHFNRQVAVGCMFCHVNHVDHVPGTINRYDGPIFQGSIDCERCHGPGAEHAKLRQAELDGQDVQITTPDFTIVNPRDLPADLREAVCQQCHLQGGTAVSRPGREQFDFRPGLPLHEFFEQFLMREQHLEGIKSVGQVQQMYSSKCFIESRKRNPDKSMGCISCHFDGSHAKPATENMETHYRAACLKCHSDDSHPDKDKAPACSIPVAARQEKNNSCEASHMPKAELQDIVHTALSDHRILRRKDQDASLFVPKGEFPELPIVSFHADIVRSDDDGARRDLAVACMQLLGRPMLTSGDNKTMKFMMQFAGSRLARVAEEQPDDVEAACAYANLLLAQERPADAIKLIERVLERCPNSEVAYGLAAGVAELATDTKLAIQCYRRAIELNPSDVYHRLRLKELFQRERMWKEVVEQCEQIRPWLLDDLRFEHSYIEALVRVGQREKAEKAFKMLEKIYAKDEKLSELRNWWKNLIH